MKYLKLIDRIMRRNLRAIGSSQWYELPTADWCREYRRDSKRWMVVFNCHMIRAAVYELKQEYDMLKE